MLTAKAARSIDRLTAEWRATEQVVAELEAEIPYPLSRVVEDIEAVLQRKSFYDRVTEKLAQNDAWQQGTGPS